MSDHPDNDVSVLVTLDQATLCRAARLGGLPIALDDNPIDDPETSIEVMRHFAKRGIAHAIHDSFDRLYPPHYPADFEDIQNIGGTDVGYQWGHVWRGTAKW